MKRIALLVLLVSSGLAQAEEYTDVGRVISADPVYIIEQRPTQRCWTESETVTTTTPKEKSLGGAIIGGIAGGILGHQVGGGGGKDVATAVGAATGAIAGDRVDNQGSGTTQTTTRPVQRCETQYGEQRVLSGYRVTYQYMNRTFTTNLPGDPGANVNLRVNVQPEGAPLPVATPAPLPDDGYARPHPRRYR